jgi:regulator of replication initiation timing
MSKSVSRKKYEHLKNTARKWMDESEKLKENCSSYIEKNEKLVLENKELRDQLNKKTFNNVTHDPDLMDELETENKTFRKELRSLKRNKKVLNEKIIDKISKLERDILLKDGKIQRLEEAKKDLKERYSELKEDFREQQRWNRKRE